MRDEFGHRDAPELRTAPAESHAYAEVTQLTAFLSRDVYSNLALKSLSCLDWFLQYCRQVSQLSAKQCEYSLIFLIFKAITLSPDPNFYLLHLSMYLHIYTYSYFLTNLRVH